MNVALWIVTVLLALAFLAAGLPKVLKGKAGFAGDPRMAWTEDFSDPVIRFIGTAEVLAVIGLIVPALTSIAPKLVGWAAAGLVLVMLGALITHARRGERQQIVITIVLALLAAFVAWGRLGSYAF